MKRIICLTSLVFLALLLFAACAGIDPDGVGEYEITYHINGGVNHPDNPARYHSEEGMALAAPTPGDNMTFEGWYRDAEYTKPIEKIEAGTTGEIVLYAKFTVAFTYTVNDGEAMLTRYLGDDAEVTVDPTIEGYPVTAIAADAFKDNATLTVLTVEEGIKRIGTSAFAGCTSLEIVFLPKSLEQIGAAAFEGCGALRELTLPFVGERRKTSAESQQYPLGYLFGTQPYSGGVQTEQNYIGIASSLAKGFFYIPESLSCVTVTDSAIMRAAFDHCSMIDSIILEEGVTGIGRFAFYDCTSLTTLTVPDSVTSIGLGAFAACTSLEVLSLPFIGDMRKDGDDPYQCPLGYVFGYDWYPDSVQITQSYLGATTDISQTYYLPASLRVVAVRDHDLIHTGAFQNCRMLTDVVIGERVRSVQSIAFDGCTSLQRVFFSGTLAQWDGITFGNYNAPFLQADVYVRGEWDWVGERPEPNQ